MLIIVHIFTTGELELRNILVTIDGVFHTLLLDDLAFEIRVDEELVNRCLARNARLLEILGGDCF